MKGQKNFDYVNAFTPLTTAIYWVGAPLTAHKIDYFSDTALILAQKSNTIMTPASKLQLTLRTLANGKF